MKYDHMVKLNGKYYKPGEEVPEVNQKTDEETDELAMLKAAADQRGISYHWNAGAEKIRAQIEEYDRQNGAR